MRSLTILPLCLSAFALLCGCGGLQHPAPNAGEPIGTVRIVNIGAMWCAECVYDMSALERLRDQFGDRLDVQVLLLDGSPESVAAFRRKQSIDLPLLFDRTQAFTQMFHVEAVPKSLVYGCNGELRAVLDAKLGTSIPAQLRKDISWTRPDGAEFIKSLLNEESCKAKL